MSSETQDAKKQIYKVQDENRRTYNLRCRQAHKYQLHDLVAIKRTQFGPGLKLKQKYLDHTKLQKSSTMTTYDVEKRGRLPGHDGRCRVGYVQWTTPPPVLRLEQSTLTSHPVMNVRLKGRTGKYVDRR
ncbi:uncharacterized protein TNCV_4505651 [Trichonephila clavipes]|nr:uncharacterized protein TNCV_4505651 [Trichonephila clavipes]